MPLDTVIRLGDLLDEAELARQVATENVRVGRHATAPLAIYNYTPIARKRGAWNDVTSVCRGLIVNTETGQIVARPWAKFWEYRTGSLDLATPVEATDKLDGSLGILYHDGAGWAVATRGGFRGHQALHATRVLRARYPDFAPPAGLTVLVEVIFPANRIVVDYGGFDDLVLLGAVETATGRALGPAAVPGWTGPVTDVMRARTLGEALALPPRPETEGLVLRTDDGRMFKIKEERYRALHYVLTETSARVIWEHLAVWACRHQIGKPLHWGSRVGLNPNRVPRIIETGPDWQDTLINGVPAEFRAWVTATIDQLNGDVDRRRTQIATRAAEIADKPGWDRRDVAEALASDPDRGLIIAALDGSDLACQLWREVYPDHVKPFAQHEDN